MRRGRRLAIDVGDARIGVASCDPDGILATPVETVPGRDVPAAHRRLAAARRGVRADRGRRRPASLPQAAARARPRPRSAAFAQELAQVIAPVPVRLVDERMTTVTASSGAARLGREVEEGPIGHRPGRRRGHPAEALESERVSGKAPGEGVEVVI